MIHVHNYYCTSVLYADINFCGNIVKNDFPGGRLHALFIGGFIPLQ